MSCCFLEPGPPELGSSSCTLKPALGNVTPGPASLCGPRGETLSLILGLAWGAGGTEPEKRPEDGEPQSPENYLLLGASDDPV